MATFPPALNAPAEDVDSPFYGKPVPTPTLKALSVVDGVNGRWCSASGVFVPAHRLKWFNNRPYLDVLCPTENVRPPDVPAGVS